MLRYFISRIFCLIAVLYCTFLCITCYAVTLKKKKMKTKRKSNLSGRGKKALNNCPGFPGLGRGGQSIPFLFSILNLESLALFICCNQKSLWATKNIIDLKHHNFSFHFVLLSVEAGTIWYWQYRARADRLQYHVESSFSSDGSLHFLIWSSCIIFTRLSIRFLTLNSDLQETRLVYQGETATASIQIFVGDMKEKEINSQYPDLYMKKRKILPPPLSPSIFHSLRQRISLQKECEVFFPFLCLICSPYPATALAHHPFYYKHEVRRQKSV